MTFGHRPLLTGPPAGQDHSQNMATDFATELRKERSGKRLSQRELGELIDIEPSTISTWEGGKRKRPPSRETVATIEVALEISDGRLLAAAGYSIDRSGTASIPVSADASAAGESAVATSLSYGGVPLSADQEREILAYIDFVKNRDSTE